MDGVDSATEAFEVLDRPSDPPGGVGVDGDRRQQRQPASNSENIVDVLPNGVVRHTDSFGLTAV